MLFLIATVDNDKSVDRVLVAVMYANRLQNYWN